MAGTSRTRLEDRGGATVHVFLDRKPNRRTKRRVVELYLIWLVATGGFFAALGGFGHIGPLRDKIAEQIGPAYIPSMFQWENAWGDIAVGAAMIICIWRRNGFLTATVLIWTILFWGDALGHLMQLVSHGNHFPSNVWGIPYDFVAPLAAIILLILYRRFSRELEEPEVEGAAA